MKPATEQRAAARDHLIAPISPEIEPRLLAFNNAHATELSWLEPDRFSILLGRAFHGGSKTVRSLALPLQPEGLA